MTKKIPVTNISKPSPKPITKKAAVQMVSNLLYAAGLDVDQKVIRRQPIGELRSIINTSALMSRSALASGIGQSFYGKRDLYDAVGWKKELEFDDYLIMYKRNPIAARVVDLRAAECWRKFPVLHDGKTADDYQDDTPFLKAWLEMVDTLNLQSVFNGLDTALGISQYAVIVIGVEGDAKYNEPLNEKGNKNIKFLKVLDEGQADMVQPVTDIYSPRYGLPNFYNCKFEEGGVATPVHWTRIVHFKQGRGRSNVYGIPGLQRSFNALQDMEKVMASSSEAFWQHIRKTIIMLARDGFQFPAPGTPEYLKLDEKADMLEHRMRQVIQLSNMDIEQLQSQVVDGKQQYDLCLSVVAGGEGYPKRIFEGSEEGNLASSQDIVSMNNSTAARQTKDCEPWLRQFVQYLYTYQFLPPPSSGKFQIEWLSLYEMNPMEKVELGIKKAEFLDKVTGGNIEQGMLVEDLVYETLDGYVKPEADEPITDKTKEVDKADTTDAKKDDMPNDSQETA